MLNYKALAEMPPLITRGNYSERDTMLYALGVGAAQENPEDTDELRFVWEKDLVALPTMAVVMAYPGPWIRDPKFGVDYTSLLHGEQKLTVHAKIPTSADIHSTQVIEGIYDKGADKGAVLYTARELRDAATGIHIATLRGSAFLRGNGGFGGTSEGAPKPHPNAEGLPDLSLDIATRTDQAILYRLSGDYNALHIDPELAKQAGFERPILHGLCTYGIAGRAAVKALCGGDPTLLRRFDVRFSAPVLPGDTLRIKFWMEGAGKAAMRVEAVERSLTVIQNGYVEFAV